MEPSFVDSNRYTFMYIYIYIYDEVDDDDVSQESPRPEPPEVFLQWADPVVAFPHHLPSLEIRKSN